MQIAILSDTHSRYHTVEKALTRAYAKLGVRSRTELARRLTDLEATPAEG